MKTNEEVESISFFKKQGSSTRTAAESFGVPKSIDLGSSGESEKTQTTTAATGKGASSKKSDVETNIQNQEGNEEETASTSANSRTKSVSFGTSEVIEWKEDRSDRKNIIEDSSLNK